MTATQNNPIEVESLDAYLARQTEQVREHAIEHLRFRGQRIESLTRQEVEMCCRELAAREASARLAVHQCRGVISEAEKELDEIRGMIEELKARREAQIEPWHMGVAVLMIVILVGLISSLTGGA